ncbi:MAG: PilC/PilY family type IV pilus protein [Desulfomonilaceae bacterium]|nr:PilC/PilY family type IV pilus protein [Desulfomonilaceae bacterium]
MNKTLLSPLHCRWVVLLLICFFYPSGAIADQKICAPPPLVQSVAVAQPNVLFVLGNGVTMGEYAYASTFEPGRKYYGYFDPDKVYRYHNYPKHYFEAVGDAVDDPATTGIRERAAGLQSEPSRKVFSGNWLNWLTMRRMDVAKKVITGGKLGGDPDEYVLVGDTLAYQNHNEGDHWTRSFVDGDKKSGVYYTPFYTGSKDVSLLVSFSTFDRTHRPDGQVKHVPLFKITAGNSVVSGDPAYENMGATHFRGVDFRAEPYPELMISCSDSTLGPGSTNSLHCGGVGAASCEADYWQTKGNCASYPCDDTKILNETWVKDLQFRCGSYYLAVKFGDVVDSTTGTLLDPPQGVIQKVVGRVRIGFMQYNTGWGPADTNPPGGQGAYYNPLSYDWTINGRIDYVSRLSDGGQVLVPVGKAEFVDSYQQYTDGAGVPQAVSMPKIIQKINKSHPQGFTPVTETMKEAMRYFEQKPPCYMSDCDPESNKGNELHGWCVSEQVPNFEVDRTWDPFYDEDYDQMIACGQSHIVYLTDGDPLKNAKADEGAGTCSTGQSVPLTAPKPAKDVDDTGTLLDDVTFTLRTQDLRPDIDGTQTVKFHAVQCFDTTDAPKLISAARAGGFNDANENGQIDPGEWEGDKVDSSGKPLPANFYKAEDGYQLEQELLAIFTEISAQGSGGAVATVSQETRAGDLIVRGAFFHKVNQSRTKGIWNGHLETWWPDPSTGIYDFELYGLSFCSDIIVGEKQRNCWDAGEILTTAQADSRLILTWLELPGTPSGGIKPWNEPEMFELKSSNADILMGPMELATNEKAQALVQWVRGKVDDNGNPIGVSGGRLDSTVEYRDRKRDLDSGPQWLLGDIIYSTPVVVGAPTLASAVPGSPHYQDYLTYRANNFYRPKMVYVGGNDGMLHAFLLARWDDTTKEWVHDPRDSRCTDCGTEVWAYVPSSLLPDLQRLAKPTYGTSTCQHLAMVDLAPQAFDVYIDHDGDGTREWRTIVIGGLRGGGDAYFAIDVTEPPVPGTPGGTHTWDKTNNPNPRILWEYSVLKNLAVAYEDTSSPTKIKIARPYADPDLYSRIRDLSLSWSESAIGRMIIPSAVKFTIHRPDYTQVTSAAAKAPAWIREDLSFSDDVKYRHVAFIGGGFRIFKQPNWDGMALYPTPDVPDTRRGLFKPNLLAIDIETGYNLFQEVWPLATKYAPYNEWSGSPPTEVLWELKTVDQNTIPYSLSHVIGVDVWDQKNGVRREDGFMDRLYLGDLFGYFYGLKFNYEDPGDGTGSLFARLEMRRTKQVNTDDDPNASNYRTNYYRHLLQPITGKFGATWNASKTGLTIMFGTGKFDNVDGTVNDDMNDVGVMSAYAAGDFIEAVNPADSSEIQELSISTSAGYEVTPQPDPTKSAIRVSGSNFALEISQRTCPGTGNSTTFDPDPLTHPCTENTSGVRSDCSNWATADIGDCAEADAGAGKCVPVPASSYSPCWDCIYDFSTPGERVIDRPLVAGGLVFYSTAIPPEDKNPCDVAQGTGNLYVFDYGCRPFPDGFTAVPTDGTIAVIPIFNEAGEKIGEKVSFPGSSGVPSRPILDSAGKNVLIQKSNSELIKIPVNLLVKTTQVTGWRER